jgi:acetyl-CoA acyltransferase
VNGSEDGRRVAIVAGLRTPFAKRGTAYARLSALELGALCTAELLARAELDPAEIDQVVFGQVVPSLDAPNVAREIVLALGLPPRIEAYSVSRACATGYQSAVSAAEAILAGSVGCAIAGGTDSASSVPVALSDSLAHALAEASRARSLPERLKALSELRPADLKPRAPSLEERSTGLTMGESAERMAKQNGISRAAQDEFAHRSHARAAAAWDEGRLRDEVMAVWVPPDETPIAEDNLVRRDSAIENYAKLEPVFDRRHGTITAGNSSPLTDGAAAMLVMHADKAAALGLEPLGYLRSWAFVGVDPADQLLIGPVYATPIALERAGLALADMDLVDMHEAFAAQMLSVLQAFESDAFARERLGRDRALGAVDPAKLNVNGGSIAMGHPFAATGVRQITQTLCELRRRGGRHALVTACAAGGLGAALVLEAP